MKKLNEWYEEKKQDIFSYFKRNLGAYLVALFCLWYIGFDTDILKLLMQGLFFASIAIPTTGFVTWGLTKMKLDTSDVSRVYFAVMLVFAFAMYMK